LRATTVADVADAAGVAKGTMYLYFDSKDALIAALRARYLDGFSQAMTAAAGASATDRLRRLVDGLFTFAARNHALHHLLFHESGFSEEDAFTSVRVTLAGIIADGVAAGEMSVADPEVAASFLLHGVHGSLIETHHGGAKGARVKRAPGQLAALADRAVAVSRDADRTRHTR
jgi:AcrR family transcriptional regulator